MRANDIVEGCASILWAMAWADHAYETGCYSLSGCEITEHMPPIPDEAYLHAAKIVGMYEQASGLDIHALLWACLTADGIDAEEEWEDYAERFGQCLAFMATGTGVSWFDDHAKYEKMPRVYADSLDCGLPEEYCPHHDGE